jgi:2-succinyl-5-enolpyruvyl-6-hydroxy-3-cyclohexene-1-carboxylate synthase
VDATNANTALASALIEELARCGMRHAAISPGSRSTPIALALHRHPAIEAAVILDERSAGYFALGAAQQDGVPVAVACTSGTAAANLHPAVVEADEAGVPLLVLTSDRPPELRGTGAGQTIDQLKLYGSAVRWFCEVGTHPADDPGLLHYRATACRAYAAAAGDPRPGPVHVNLAWREPLAPSPEPGSVSAMAPLALQGRGERPLNAVLSVPPTPDPAILDDLAERVRAAPRGLIVAGRQRDPRLAAAAAELAASAGYPILPEPTSQLRLGAHDRSRVVWTYDSIARVSPERLAPEIVIRFGDLPTSKPLRGWLAGLEGLSEIVVDPAFDWNDPGHGAETLLRVGGAELAAGLTQRLGEPSGERPGGWEREWLEAGAAAAEAIESTLAGLDEPTEPGIHRALADLYADGEIVFTASSMPIRDQEAFVPASAAAVRFLCNRGANGLDGLVSAGIGAAAASGRPTWIVTGDLGLFHDSNAPMALRHARSPVRIVVVNNGGGGIFEFLPQAELLEREEFEALFGTPAGLNPGRLADLYGIPHRRLERPDELEAVDETCMIELAVDRRRNVEVHRRLADAVARAVGAERG